MDWDKQLELTTNIVTQCSQDNAQTCMQQSQENLWSTGYLHRNVYAGSGKMQEHENHTDNVQIRQTDESWWMMSQTSHTKESHKSIVQLNHTG